MKDLAAPRQIAHRLDAGITRKPPLAPLARVPILHEPGGIDPKFGRILGGKTRTDRGPHIKGRLAAGSNRLAELQGLMSAFSVSPTSIGQPEDCVSALEKVKVADFKPSPLPLSLGGNRGAGFCREMRCTRSTRCRLRARKCCKPSSASVAFEPSPLPLSLGERGVS